jgi:hypothetical protein
MANQQNKLWRLQGEGVDFAITDSPILLNLAYVEDNYYTSYKPFVKEVFDSFNNHNFFMERVKPYMKYGRNQTEDEARHLDAKVANLLTLSSVPFQSIKADKEAPETIFNMIKGD